MKLRHISDIDFSKASRGWNCEIHFRVQTQRQCTMESHYVKGYGRKGWRGVFGLISSFIDAYKRTNTFCQELQAISGDWNLDGTSKRATA